MWRFLYNNRQFNFWNSLKRTDCIRWWQTARNNHVTSFYSSSFPKGLNTSPIWKTKRTLLYYRLWIQFSGRKSMFAVCHNGTLNFFTFDLHGPNFNLWPLSPTNITNLKNFVPQVRLRYFCRKTHRSLPWSRPRVLREYICIPHFRAISHAILHSHPREGKRRPHLQSAVLYLVFLTFCTSNSFP